MSDILTVSSGLPPAMDWQLAGGNLAADDGLDSAVLISLFTDRRANDDDVLPDAGGDRRGWWGDSYNPDSKDRIGSRLWLLSREKQLAKVLTRAQDYAEEALAWLVADGVASRVTVIASNPRMGLLALDIAIDRPQHPTARYRFERFWNS